MMVAPPRQNRSTEARLGARIQQLEQCLEAALERIDRMEPVPRAPVMDAPLLADIMEGVRARVDELHVLVAEDLLSFEKSLQAQAVAIDSARTAAAQTDDLVERVVEAVESLSSR